MREGSYDWRRCVFRAAEPGEAFAARIASHAPSRPPEQQAAIDAHWAARCAENPRLFDGHVLAFGGFDAPRGLACTVCRDRFRSLAAWPALPGAIRQLGVTGVLVARDGLDRPHALLGRRGLATRVYGGMWELGPSGGVDPPAATETATLGPDDVLAALRAEIQEELGAPLEPRRVEIVGAIDDVIGGSVDLVVRVELAEALAVLTQRLASARAEHAWEYEATAWVRTDAVAAFDAEHESQVIPPTRAIFRALGWTGDRSA